MSQNALAKGFGSQEDRLTWCHRCWTGLLAALLLASISSGRGQNACYTDHLLFSNQSVLGLSVATNGTIYYADYFGGAFGFLDLTNGALIPLIDGLASPSAVQVWGEKVYFTESGTEAGLYHDGALSVFDIPTATRTVISTGLEYPVSLFADVSGNIYVLEAAGSSTSYGGSNCLIEFAAGSDQYQVVIPFIPEPAGVVINSRGTIFVGSYGPTIPGDGGTLFAYAPGETTPATIATGLPAIYNLAIDSADNIYIAGFGDDGPIIGGFGADDGPMVAIAMLPNASNNVIPLQSGFQAWCLALDSQHNIYYSTGGSVNSIRRLTPCNLPTFTVVLTGPPSVAPLAVPTNIVLTATTSDAFGNVTNVEYLAGNNLVGQSSSQPFFECVWPVTSAGVYSVVAVAMDDAGNVATSLPVRLTVTLPNPPMNDTVWVFHDEDPNYTDPIVGDTLSALNEIGQSLFTIAGFNIDQTVGGHRAVAAADNGRAAIVCEDVNGRLSKINSTGNAIFSISLPVQAADVGSDGTIFALGNNGTIYGSDIVKISPQGAITEQTNLGGFDLVVDNQHQAIFEVGADIKYLDLDLNLIWSISPIVWVAVSVDVASDGSAWVAERLHSQVPGSVDRLLKVSSQGTILQTVNLSYSPWCVRVDRADDSLYVGGDNLYKYDRDGTLLFSSMINASAAWSLAVDSSRRVWVGTYSDVREFASDGTLLLVTNEFGNPSDTFLAVGGNGDQTAASTAIVTNGFVVGALITDAGGGYTNAPIVQFTGGGGNGAKAIAVVSNGVVVAINILAAGEGYTNPPVVIIAPPILPQPIAATATATLVDGFVVAATVTDGGAGYTNTPRVEIIGGGGSGAQAIAVVNNGAVVAIEVLNAGYGYTNAPIIAITPPFPLTLGVGAATSLTFTNLTTDAPYQVQILQSGTWEDFGPTFNANAASYLRYVDGVANSASFRLVSYPDSTGATATPILSFDFVVAATVVDGGSGYLQVPGVQIIGGGGSGAQATATVANGMVTGVNIIDAGFGYTTPPMILIDPPPVSALQPVAANALRLDCNGLTQAMAYQLQASTDLASWTNFGATFIAAANSTSQYVPVGTGCHFFRLSSP